MTETMQQCPSCGHDIPLTADGRFLIHLLGKDADRRCERSLTVAAEDNPIESLLEGLPWHIRGRQCLREWLNRAYTQEATGVELVHAVPGADNVATADRLLHELEDHGIIERVSYAPGFSMAAFLSLERRKDRKGGHAVDPRPDNTYPREWSWRVVR